MINNCDFLRVIPSSNFASMSIRSCTCRARPSHSGDCAEYLCAQHRSRSNHHQHPTHRIASNRLPRTRLTLRWEVHLAQYSGGVEAIKSAEPARNLPHDGDLAESSTHRRNLGRNQIGTVVLAPRAVVLVQSVWHVEREYLPSIWSALSPSGCTSAERDGKRKVGDPHPTLSWDKVHVELGNGSGDLLQGWVRKLCNHGIVGRIDEEDVRSLR